MKQTIKMIAHNPITKRYEEVFPESEVDMSELIPRFWCEKANTWISIPGKQAVEVYDKWVEQMNQSGGEMPGVKGKSGRKAKPDAVRTSIHISKRVYEWLNRNGNASAEIERIALEKMKGEKKEEENTSQTTVD